MVLSIKEDAIHILNEFIADICVGVEVLKDYEHGIYPNRDELFKQGIYRLCLQSIFLNCAKYTEFCREYGQVLNECCQDLTKLNNQVKAKFEQRGINAFRSKYIAHNRCDKTKKPFTLEEIKPVLAALLIVVFSSFLFFTFSDRVFIGPYFLKSLIVFVTQSEGF